MYLNLNFKIMKLNTNATKQEIYLATPQLFEETFAI